MRLIPGTCVVMEGLDGAGKSTQTTALRALPWKVTPAFAHMPSGFSSTTNAIYRLTEGSSISSPLARQLLHLAAHAESLQELRRLRASQGLVLDRWWWSTVAYGWFGGLRDQLDKRLFFDAVRLVWSGFDADVIFTFLTSHTADPKNDAAVVEGYEWLAAQQPRNAIRVPTLGAEATTTFLVDELRRRGVIDG